MNNPAFPQTETEWAYKQIFKKGSNRIEALHQPDMKLSSGMAENLPSVQELNDIKNFIFRIDADTPALRKAVENELNNLKLQYPEYNFSAIFGGEQ